MTISSEMIEAAAKAIWEASHPNPPGWIAWGDRTEFGPSIQERKVTISQAIAALTADAPEIAAAEARGKIEGLTEAGRMISGYRETVPGREPGPLAQIDARIAAIREKDETT